MSAFVNIDVTLIEKVVLYHSTGPSDLTHAKNRALNWHESGQTRHPDMGSHIQGSRKVRTKEVARNHAHYDVHSEHRTCDRRNYC